MMNKNQVFLSLMAIALFIVGIVSGLGPVQAAPPAAPTPVANLTADYDAAPIFFRFQTATAITADTNTSAKELMKYDALDVSYTIDQGTTNTTTLTIEWSNDNSNWVTGATIVSATGTAAGDVTGITRVPVFGRYGRVKQDVTNSNTITLTLLAVGR